MLHDAAEKYGDGGGGVGRGERGEEQDSLSLPFSLLDRHFASIFSGDGDMKSGKRGIGQGSCPMSSVLDNIGGERVTIITLR